MPQVISIMATTLHGRCVSGDSCKCTKYQESGISDGLCKFCDHDISEHIIIAVVSADGNSIQLLESPNPVVSSSELITSVPSVAKKERMVLFGRAKYYSPNITGKSCLFKDFVYKESLSNFTFFLH